MNLICTGCGESWEFWHVMDGFHEGTSKDDGFDLTIENGQVAGIKGCSCCNANKKHPSKTMATRATIAQITYDLLGGDIDGAAAMLEDAEDSGMFESDMFDE